MRARPRYIPGMELSEINRVVRDVADGDTLDKGGDWLVVRGRTDGPTEVAYGRDPGPLVVVSVHEHPDGWRAPGYSAGVSVYTPGVGVESTKTGYVEILELALANALKHVEALGVTSITQTDSVAPERSPRFRNTRPGSKPAKAPRAKSEHCAEVDLAIQLGIAVERPVHLPLPEQISEYA